jgi:GT2 family glycosyltransferase
MAEHGVRQPLQNKQPLSIIIPTAGYSHLSDCLASLSYLKNDITVHIVRTGNSWAEAVNHGIAMSSGDVILMDDDVRLTHKSRIMECIEKYGPYADILGFKLVFENKRIQHAGGMYRSGMIHHRCYNQIDIGQADFPQYVCHVTTSLAYIKRSVIDKIGVMGIYPKIKHFEDVEYSFRAIKAGFKILFTPGEAIHLETQTKSQTQDYMLEKEGLNEIIGPYLNDDSFTYIIEDLPRPYEQIQPVQLA